MNRPNVRWHGLHIAITLPIYPEFKALGWSDDDTATFFKLVGHLVLEGHASMTSTPFNAPTSDQALVMVQMPEGYQKPIAARPLPSTT